MTVKVCPKCDTANPYQRRTWAERSRVDECTVCAGTADTPEGSTFDSPAHELRKEARADD